MRRSWVRTSLLATRSLNRSAQGVAQSFESWKPQLHVLYSPFIEHDSLQLAMRRSWVRTSLLATRSLNRSEQGVAQSFESWKPQLHVLYSPFIEHDSCVCSIVAAPARSVGSDRWIGPSHWICAIRSFDFVSRGWRVGDGVSCSQCTQALLTWTRAAG